MRRILQSPPTTLAAVAAALLLAAAYFSQYALGYAPCDLCFLQRYPYMAIVALGLLALFLPPPGRRAVLLLIALLFLADAAIAIYHSLIEWKLITGTAQCSAAPTAQGIDALRARIMGSPVVRCDEPAFRLLGFSMANMNAVAALALGVYCLASLRRGGART